MTLHEHFLKELETEAVASRKCLERVPDTLYAYKPHERSMAMGYLALLVAEIPKWIAHSIEKSVIDFGTWERFQWKTSEELTNHFDKCLVDARTALRNVSDSALLNETFSLRNQGQVLLSSSKYESVGSSLNHWVHHRGQLTVYMRLNGIPVPAIYGPSADDKTF
jgi:uncharacterized damage-inducible protein DinB